MFLKKVFFPFLAIGVTLKIQDIIPVCIQVCIINSNILDIISLFLFYILKNKFLVYYFKKS
jgi:hypothetical protein